jgi:hypothetical protein
LKKINPDPYPSVNRRFSLLHRTVAFTGLARVQSERAPAVHDAILTRQRGGVTVAGPNLILKNENRIFFKTVHLPHIYMQ